jgi:hypothetical protein
MTSQIDTRTCWAPGDQEHDHDMCVDAVAERERDQDRQCKINAIRTMADYLEAHPEMPVPSTVSMFTHTRGRADVDAVDRARPDAKLKAHEHTYYTVETVTIDGVEFQSFAMAPVPRTDRS